MPTYRYRCGTCGGELEVWQSFTETPLTTHEGCGGALAKVMSPAGIVLKGSGFYKNDSRSNGGRRSEKRDSGKKDKESTSTSSSSGSDGGSSSKSSSDTSTSDSKSDSSKSSSGTGSSGGSSGSST